MCRVCAEEIADLTADKARLTERVAVLERRIDAHVRLVTGMHRAFTKAIRDLNRAMPTSDELVEPRTG